MVEDSNKISLKTASFQVKSPSEFLSHASYILCFHLQQARWSSTGLVLAWQCPFCSGKTKTGHNTQDAVSWVITGTCSLFLLPSSVPGIPDPQTPRQRFYTCWTGVEWEHWENVAGSLEKVTGGQFPRTQHVLSLIWYYPSQLHARLWKYANLY